MVEGTEGSIFGREIALHGDTEYDGTFLDLVRLECRAPVSVAFKNRALVRGADIRVRRMEVRASEVHRSWVDLGSDRPELVASDAVFLSCTVMAGMPVHGSLDYVSFYHCDLRGVDLRGVDTNTCFFFRCVLSTGTLTPEQVGQSVSS